jgi:predicted RNA binding protein YcfA (HicA-like mRNA interferase family)
MIGTGIVVVENKLYNDEEKEVLRNGVARSRFESYFSANMKGKKALKTYSYKEFKALLGTLGFFEHHKNSTHMVFANAEHRYVTVPFSNKKEINPMMTTVTLQRIKNHQCRIL